VQHLPDKHFITRLYRRFCNLIYHECSWAYDITSFVVSAGQWNAWRTIAFKYLSKGNTLELGCGTGYLLKEGLSQKLDITGFDISAQMLKHSGNLLKKNHLNGPLVRGNGMQLPFLNASFKNIVATFPEQYITQTQTISECARILDDSPDHNSKIIILGRWIVLHHPILRILFPVFYRLPSESQKNEVKSLFNTHGLNAQFHEHRMGLVSVYVIEAKFSSN